MNKKFCQHCGEKIDEKADFCQHCGTAQNEYNSTVQDFEPQSGKVNMITAFKHNWDNAFFISGRTGRANYWFNYLDMLIINLISFIVLRISGYNNILLFIYSIMVGLMVCINFTSTIRRLHDTNRSGNLLWLSLIPLIGSIILVILFSVHTKNSGRFNTNRKQNNIWYKKWWTWLIIAFLALFYFSVFNNLVNAEIKIAYELNNFSNNDSSNKFNNSSSNYQSSDNDVDEILLDNPKLTNGNKLKDFDIGPLKFTKVFSGILKEKSISENSAEYFFQTFDGKIPSGFFKEGKPYKQIILTYKVKNTSNQNIHFPGLINNNNLLMPDGTKLNQLDSDDFYSGEKQNNPEIKPGSTIQGCLFIQLKGKNKNYIPKGNYKFTTGTANAHDYSTVSHSIDFEFNPYK
ncbi:DUF805 domain-containing protein [Apilactobacillus xinyiensis]|uniref:DUF805 domain-containing protein n=1 Tax=Apilactobacillus xinyiensis TaxID=2841032 RepID=UPI00200E9412|nr:DUF805 domain-containing protein [Apilactobacillus xinyiensis]MCL0330669.1 DUF805 domain-containing protein [Apilactobacillus xinyiensis]